MNRGKWSILVYECGLVIRLVSPVLLSIKNLGIKSFAKRFKRQALMNVGQKFYHCTSLAVNINILQGCYLNNLREGKITM